MNALKREEAAIVERVWLEVALNGPWSRQPEPISKLFATRIRADVCGLLVGAISRASRARTAASRAAERGPFEAHIGDVE